MWAILATLGVSGVADGPERAMLRESARDEVATRAVVTLQGGGDLSGRPPRTTRRTRQAARPYKLKVETRFAFDERVVARDADGRASAGGPAG